FGKQRFQLFHPLLEAGDRAGLLVTLLCQRPDLLAIAAKLDAQHGSLVLRLLQVDLETAHGHGILGAQAVLFRLELAAAQGHRRLDTAPREPCCALREPWNREQREEGRAQEAETENEDRLDHGRRSVTRN